jgi:5-hydroxyisourate hydrolase
MNGISTHVLDAVAGRPAAGIAIRLFQGDRQVGSGVTNANGRCLDLLTEPLQAGTYKIVFDILTRFPGGFYPEVSIKFLVRDPSTHYHVPLLISPFGFTTYRGS